ncbi:MAG TPA: HAD family hydrolase [Gaiellaceae bacterium]|jgi:putative hydrolase of the HAD superfamily|nr:HAD family hydrolase [Gaiellaceae bacterium]
MNVRAVVFDLWDTLVDFDPAGSRAFQDRVAERLGRDPEEFAAFWLEGRPTRDSGPLHDYLRAIGADPALADELVELRHEATRRMLTPRPGAVETLRELRARGILVGLISVCSEDVPNVWDKTPFAGLFDSTVFSCSVGLRKPDPRIYRLALEELGVDARESVFVGDGANDELAGAERVGMRAVLIHRDGEEPYWDEAREWRGPRVTSVPAVLALLEAEDFGRGVVEGDPVAP